MAIPKTLSENAKRLEGDRKRLAQQLLKYIADSGLYAVILEGDKHDNLFRACGWGEHKSIKDAFLPGSEIYEVVSGLIGPDNADLARRMWERCTLYNYERRSYRTFARDWMHFPKAFRTLRAFIVGVGNGFTVEKYLQNYSENSGKTVFPGEDMFTGPLLAMLLDGENEEADQIFAALESIINDTSGAGTVRREMIAALLQSRSPRAHDLAGRLLMAARLQEGIRQTIMEEADNGSREGFTHVFKVAAENDLIRYSSVARAFFTWTGLVFDIKSRKVKAAFADAWKCLADPAFRRECLDGKDSLRIYLALWALSFDGVEHMVEEAESILRKGPRHRKVPALITTAQLQDITIQTRLAALCLANPDDVGDDEIMAWSLGCMAGLYHVETEGRSDATPWELRSVLRVGDAERRSLYTLLKNCLGSIDWKKGKERTVESDLAPEIKAVLSRSAFLKKMTAVLERPVLERMGYALHGKKAELPELATGWDLDFSISPSWHLDPMERDALDDDAGADNLRDDLCGYFDSMDADCKRSLLLQVVRDGSASAVQRAVVVKLLGERAKRITEDALCYLAKSKMTDAEILEIEGPGYLLS